MCDGKQKYEDYKVDAVVSPQSAKSPCEAKRRMGVSTNSGLSGRNKCKQSGGLFFSGTVGEA